MLNRHYSLEVDSLVSKDRLLERIEQSQRHESKRRTGVAAAFAVYAVILVAGVAVLHHLDQVPSIPPPAVAAP